jgi:hypothetical protein
VGGLTLQSSEGARDHRLAGLPAAWTERIPAGDEFGHPLWYRRSFIERLRDAATHQEIGLHGGLTHLIWTHPHSTREVVKQELAEGMRALEQISVRPRSFSFGRDQEAYHDLLPPHGIRCYRGRTPVLAFRLGRTVPGAMMRILDELREATPPPVWPTSTRPGLWNIPSSIFLYPIGESRARLVPLRTRVHRFRRGLEAAIRRRGIFHYSFHPDNLAESPSGFSLLGDMLELLTHARDAGDIEIVTMGQAAERASRSRESHTAALSRSA